MISICLTCANNKAGRCAALNTDIIDIIDYFVCDFYQEKRTGAYRRKKAKVNRGKRGAGKEYVMKKIIMEGNPNDQIKK